MEYWRQGAVCLAFNQAPCPGVWQGHFGHLDGHEGQLERPTAAILAAFWREHDPRRIVGWVSSNNRAALAFFKRVGFVEDGSAPLGSESIIFLGWRPTWAEL
jgi:hypothetical protein